MNESEMSMNRFLSLEGFLKTKRNTNISTLAKIGNSEVTFNYNFCNIFFSFS